MKWNFSHKSWWFQDCLKKITAAFWTAKSSMSLFCILGTINSKWNFFIFGNSFPISNNSFLKLRSAKCRQRYRWNCKRCWVYSKELESFSVLENRWRASVRGFESHSLLHLKLHIGVRMQILLLGSIRKMCAIFFYGEVLKLAEEAPLLRV